jgi:MFS transporter, DHA2 family, multidrug resistance protein
MTHPGLPLPRRFWAVASISAGSVLYALDGGILNVALPVISEKLGVSDSTSILLVSVYNLVLAMALLPLAAFGERIGHRLVFVGGFTLYLAASLCCLFAAGLPLLLCLRAVQALSAAGLLSVSLAMVRMVYPQQLLGRGLGFNTMASAIGAAFAPPLGGWLLAHLPWQSVFAAGLPLALIGLATSRFLPDPKPRRELYDTHGAVLCAVTFGLVISGLQAMSQQVPGLLSWALVAGGLAVAVWFVRHELKTVAPVLPVDLLARPALALSVAGGLLAVLSITVLLLYLPFRLHGLGLGSAAIGGMVAPFAITVMIAAPASGMLSDHISPMSLGTAGMAIATVGVASVIWLSVAPTFFDVAWRMAICGLGFSLFFSPNGRLVVGSVPRERAAGASSLVATTRMLGQALGATGLAGLLAFGLPAITPALIATALAVLGLLCSVARALVQRTQG